MTKALMSIVMMSAAGVATAQNGDYPVGRALNRAVELQLQAPAGPSEVHRGWYLPVAKATQKDRRPVGTFRFNLESPGE